MLVRGTKNDSTYINQYYWFIQREVRYQSALESGIRLFYSEPNAKNALKTLFSTNLTGSFYQQTSKI